MTFARWLLVASLAAIGFATLMPQATSSDLGHWCFMCGEYGAVDAILNVALFVPLGLAMALSGARARSAIPVAGVLSTLIELAQAFVIPGRNANIGDVAMNTLGAALGVALSLVARRLCLPPAKLAFGLIVAWIGLWLTVIGASAYALTIVMPDPPYYRHFNRSPAPGRDPFPGVVLSASLGDQQLTAPRLDSTPRMKALLEGQQGNAAQVVAVAAGGFVESAEIFNVSGPTMEDLLGFDQIGRDFVFGIRTGADVLRLRSYQYRLADVFHADSGIDTIVLVAGYSPSGVNLHATSSRWSRGQKLTRELSNGWRLLSPVPTYIDGSRHDRLAAVGFLLLLSAPVGYWTAFTGGSRPTDRREILVAAGVAIILMTALSTVPRMFGLPVATYWEFLSVFGGFAVAFALGVRIAALAGRVR